MKKMRRNEKKIITLLIMENVTGYYIIINISPHNALLSAMKTPFRELPKAFGRHEEAICFLLERNLSGVAQLAPFSAPPHVFG